MIVLFKWVYNFCLLTHGNATCQLSSKTLEEILNGWMEGLADDINGFSEQSLRVSQWDIQLRENQRVCSVCAVTLWAIYFTAALYDCRA